MVADYSVSGAVLYLFQATMKFDAISGGDVASNRININPKLAGALKRREKIPTAASKIHNGIKWSDEAREFCDIKSASDEANMPLILKVADASLSDVMP